MIIAGSELTIAEADGIINAERYAEEAKEREREPEDKLAAEWAAMESKSADDGSNPRVLDQDMIDSLFGFDVEADNAVAESELIEVARLPQGVIYAKRSPAGGLCYFCDDIGGGQFYYDSTIQDPAVMKTIIDTIHPYLDHSDTFERILRNDRFARGEKASTRIA